MKIQEDFRPVGEGTIAKFDAYIRHRTAVVHIGGDMAGSNMSLTTSDDAADQDSRFGHSPGCNNSMRGNTRNDVGNFRAFVGHRHRAPIAGRHLVQPLGNVHVQQTKYARTQNPPKPHRVRRAGLSKSDRALLFEVESHEGVGAQSGEESAVSKRKRP
jgi:hypothetical protein